MVVDRTNLLYFDTSALTKAIVEERGTPIIRTMLEACSPDGACASALQQVELRSAVMLRLLRKELSRDQAENAFRAIDEVLGRLAVVEVTDVLLRRAAADIRHTGLRSLDAIQLASALQAQVHAGKPILFVASDRKLLDAASRSGLSTLNPEESAPHNPHT